MKDLNPTQIIAQYVNSPSAKFDFEKVKQKNCWRVCSKENLDEVSKMCIEHHLCHLSRTKPYISLVYYLWCSIHQNTAAFGFTTVNQR